MATESDKAAEWFRSARDNMSRLSRIMTGIMFLILFILFMLSGYAATWGAGTEDEYQWQVEIDIPDADSGGTMVGCVANCSNCSDMFVNITGDTMTGDLILNDAGVYLNASGIYSPSIFQITYPRYTFSIFPDEDVLMFRMGGEGLPQEQFIELEPVGYGNRILFWKNLLSLANITSVLYFGNGSQLYDVNVSNAVQDNKSWNETYANTKYIYKTGDNVTGNINMTANNITNVKTLTVNTDMPDYTSALTVYVSDEQRYGLKVGGSSVNPTTSPVYGVLAMPSMSGTSSLTSISGVGLRGSMTNTVGTSNAANTGLSSTGLTFSADLDGFYDGSGSLTNTVTGIGVSGRDIACYTGTGNDKVTIKGLDIYAAYVPPVFSLSKSSGNMTADVYGIDSDANIAEDIFGTITENSNGDIYGINSEIRLELGNLGGDTGWRPKGTGIRSAIYLTENLGNTDYNFYNFFGDMDSTAQAIDNPYFMFNNNTNSNVKSLLAKDNIKTYFGTGEDAAVWYNSTRLVINSTGTDIIGGGMADNFVVLSQLNVSGDIFQHGLNGSNVTHTLDANRDYYGNIEPGIFIKSYVPYISSYYYTHNSTTGFFYFGRSSKIDQFSVTVSDGNSLFLNNEGSLGMQNNGEGNLKFTQVSALGNISFAGNVPIKYHELGMIDFVPTQVEIAQPLYFGIANQSTNVFDHYATIEWDGTNLHLIPNITNPNALIYGYNFSGTDFVTRTTIYDKSQGAALDKIKDAAEYLTPSSKINHSKFYGYQQHEVTDYDSCETIYTIKYCYYNASKDGFEYLCFDAKPKERASQEIKTPSTVCDTKMEDMVSLPAQAALYEQAIYELKVKNQELEARIEALEAARP